eukprot:720385-Pelagomonas_calceolata.AAC.1
MDWAALLLGLSAAAAAAGVASFPAVAPMLDAVAPAAAVTSSGDDASAALVPPACAAHTHAHTHTHARTHTHTPQHFKNSTLGSEVWFSAARSTPASSTHGARCCFCILLDTMDELVAAL